MSDNAAMGKALVQLAKSMNTELVYVDEFNKDDPEDERIWVNPRFHPDALAREDLIEKVGNKLAAAEAILHSNDQGDHHTVLHVVQGTNGNEDIVHVVTISSHIATKSDVAALEMAKAAEAAEDARLYRIAVADGTAAISCHHSASATCEDDAVIEVSMDHPWSNEPPDS